MLFIFLFITEIGFTQTHVIRGRIVDAQTNESLVAATVEIVGHSAGTVADVNRRFSITPKNFPAMLVISYVGYEPVSKQVDKDTQHTNDVQCPTTG